MTSIQQQPAPASPERTGHWRFARMLTLDVVLPLALYYARRV